jgi:hypothetical protein
MTSRLVLLLVSASLVACSVSAKDHCQERQELWEHGFGDDDPEWTAKSREMFVPSCTQMLSEPDARKELACRHRCLRAVDRSTKRSSPEARAAYGSMQRCEAGCLGLGSGEPVPVSPQE